MSSPVLNIRKLYPKNWIEAISWKSNKPLAAGHTRARKQGSLQQHKSNLIKKSWKPNSSRFQFYTIENSYSKFKFPVQVFAVSIKKSKNCFTVFGSSSGHKVSLQFSNFVPRFSKKGFSRKRLRMLLSEKKVTSSSWWFNLYERKKSVHAKLKSSVRRKN